MMKYIISFSMILCFAYSQPIQTGLTFLKLGVGARAVAMGEAFSSIIEDQSAEFYNPASLAKAKRHEVQLMHKNWIEETTTEYLGATILGENINFGFAALATSIPDIEVRTRPGEAEGTFSSRNLSLGISAGSSITENISIGISAKMLYEKIFIDEASGYGIDLGILYQIDSTWFIGSSVLNIGSMNALRSAESALPTTFRIGTSYSYNISSEFNLLGAGDFVKTFDDDLEHIHLGIEMTYDDLISLRTGYQSGYEFKSYSTGVGIKYGIVKFDYAFVPFTGAFTSSHTISLSFLL